MFGLNKYLTLQCHCEGIMLSEVSQPQTDKFGMVSLMCGISKKSNSWQQRVKTGCPGLRGVKAGGGENKERFVKE